MNLIQARIDCYRLRYTREVVWANAVEAEGLYALLTLTDDSGAVGVAEGTIKAAWSGVSARSLRAVLEDVLLPRLMARDLESPAAAAALLAGVPENRLAKAMIDNALWQIAAALDGRPLWQWWAEGGHDGRVPIAWAVTRQQPAAMAEEAARMCAAHGFRTLKVKGGQGLATDLDALAQIRSAVGPGIELFVDANGGCAPGQAIEYVQRIADAGASVAEDPCTLAPDTDFSALQRASPIPVLVDRACVEPADAAAFLDRGARALSTKPGRIGFSAAREISALAAAAGAQVALGLYAESALGTAINAQYATALGPGRALVAAEQSFHLMLADQVTSTPLSIRDGVLDLSLLPTPVAMIDRARLQRFAA